MEFTCTSFTGKRQEKWNGEIRLIKKEGERYEVEISGRGTFFHAIIGKHIYGYYICIPNLYMGCELSDYEDVFWNRERLSTVLKKTDATTVAYALTHLKEL